MATAAHVAALADDRVSFYTAPIKALVSEKFFALCAIFGPDDVGMLTGDAAVNPDAPIICCTAEVLANIALREGRGADVGLVIMDEFHYYSEPDRGWAWQVPLLELTDAQFLLMSATLGDVTRFVDDLTVRTGRETVVVDDAERPVPLSFSWALTPLAETVEELVSTHQVPAYVVHFTQAAAVEHANSLQTLEGGHPRGEGRDRARCSATSGSAPASARRCRSWCATGSGCTTPACCRATAGWWSSWPRPGCSRSSAAPTPSASASTCRSGRCCSPGWRSSTATGNGSCGPGSSSRSRAGRVGPASTPPGTSSSRRPSTSSRTSGPRRSRRPRTPHGRKRAKKKSKPQLRKPPEGTVVWSEQTFEKLVAGVPEPLVSRMKIDNAMLLNLVAREEDAFAATRRLIRESHEDERSQAAAGAAGAAAGPVAAALRACWPGWTSPTSSAGVSC